MELFKLFLRMSPVFLIIGIFLTGWLSNTLYQELNGFNLEKPFYYSFFGENKPKEQFSPYDHIKKDQVHVFEDKVVIDIKGATWAEFVDTNSMDPLLDIEANSFEIKPKSPDSVHIGDVISYKSEYEEGLIVHRVVEINEDSDGWFCRVKGDNLLAPDPGKIRFEQVYGILVGVVY